MKGTIFHLLTNMGKQSIEVSKFWYFYNHALEVHPDKDPILSSLEHCLGGPVPDIPSKVREGCQSIIDFFKPRAVPGRVLAAKKLYYQRPVEERNELETTMAKNFAQKMLLEAMPTSGMMQ